MGFIIIQSNKCSSFLTRNQHLQMKSQEPWLAVIMAWSRWGGETLGLPNWLQVYGEKPEELQQPATMKMRCVPPGEPVAWFLKG